MPTTELRRRRGVAAPTLMLLLARATAIDTRQVRVSGLGLIKQPTCFYSFTHETLYLFTRFNFCSNGMTTFDKKLTFYQNLTIDFQQKLTVSFHKITRDSPHKHQLEVRKKAHSFLLK